VVRISVVLESLSSSPVRELLGAKLVEGERK
jgi:hypothetical protein